MHVYGAAVVVVCACATPDAALSCVLVPVRVLVCAGVAAAIAVAIRKESTTINGSPSYKWFVLLCIVLVTYLLGVVINTIVFWFVSLMSSTALLSEMSFYMLALEGSVQHIVWISFAVCLCRCRVAAIPAHCHHCSCILPHRCRRYARRRPTV